MAAVLDGPESESESEFAVSDVAVGESDAGAEADGVADAEGVPVDYTISWILYIYILQSIEVMCTHPSRKQPGHYNYPPASNAPHRQHH